MGESGAAISLVGVAGARTKSRVRAAAGRRSASTWGRRCILQGRAAGQSDTSGLPSTSSSGEEGVAQGIARGLALFNAGQFYAAHDVLEAAWIESASPSGRMFLHGTLQAAVGLHHLEQRNHNGCMLELGEGLRKLRRFEGSECIGECPVTIKLFTADVGGVLRLVQASLASLSADVLGSNYAAGVDVFSVRHHDPEVHTGVVEVIVAGGEGSSCPLPRIDLEGEDIVSLLAE